MLVIKCYSTHDESSISQNDFQHYTYKETNLVRQVFFIKFYVACFLLTYSIAPSFVILKTT